MTTTEPEVNEFVLRLHRSGRPWDKRADEVDWDETAVGRPVPFGAVQFGTSAWYATGPVTITATEPLTEPAWTVSRPGETPTIIGDVGHALAEGETFTLPVTDVIIGGVKR